jgi:hypothetical protein
MSTDISADGLCLAMFEGAWNGSESEKSRLKLLVVAKVQPLLDEIERHKKRADEAERVLADLLQQQGARHGSGMVHRIGTRDIVATTVDETGEVKIGKLESQQRYYRVRRSMWVGGNTTGLGCSTLEPLADRMASDDAPDDTNAIVEETLVTVVLFDRCSAGDLAKTIKPHVAQARARGVENKREGSLPLTVLCPVSARTSWRR